MLSLLCNQKEVLKFYNNPFHEHETYHQSHVCYLDGPSVPKFTTKSAEGRAHKNFCRSIFTVIKNHFDSMKSNKEDSIYSTIDLGQAFTIYRYHFSKYTKHVVATILFSADANGIFVNWITITQTKFTMDTFKTSGNKETFRSCGIGTFLISLVQMRLVLFGWKTDVYLQVNQGFDSVKFYEKLGFQMAANNKK